jgi:hypothetical protein
MSLVSENLNIWPPEAGGSKPLFGGEFCLDTRAGQLNRAFAIGSEIGLLFECNQKRLQSSVLAKDEKSALYIVDMFMQRQGWRLEDLGMLEM